MLSTTQLPGTVVCEPLAFFDIAKNAPNLHYHLVLQVAEGAETIGDEWREQFYKFIAGCVRASGGATEAVGGTSDYVHLLVRLNTTHVLSDIVNKIKLLSATWAKRKTNNKTFAWGEFEAFTVSPTQRARVRDYIRAQAAHHRRFGRQEDYASPWRRKAIENNQFCLQ